VKLRPSTAPPTCESNPTITVDPIIGHILVSVGVAAVGVLLAPVVAVGIVGAFGFSTAGVVAGSLAATIHAGIGDVAAGSLFALAQSIGAGGALPAIFSAIAGAIGALLGAIIPL